MSASPCLSPDVAVHAMVSFGDRRVVPLTRPEGS
jgi:hypothetical protein